MLLSLRIGISLRYVLRESLKVFEWQLSNECLDLLKAKVRVYSHNELETYLAVLGVVRIHAFFDLGQKRSEGEGLCRGALVVFREV